MNYLAHLHLGGPRPGDLLGSLYGDFVKGPLQGRWPAEIEAGIRLHRQIDAFTDSHPLVLQAKSRFPANGAATPASWSICFSIIAGGQLGGLLHRTAGTLYPARLRRAGRRTGAAGQARGDRAAHGRARLAGQLSRIRGTGTGAGQHEPAPEPTGWRPAGWRSWSSCTNRCSRISATSIQRFSNSPERPEALVPQAS